MKKLLVLAAAALLLFGMSPAASAEGWDIGIKGGIAEGTGDFGEAAQSAFAWKVYFEYKFTPMFSLQAAYGRHVHDLAANFQRFLDVARPGGGEAVVGEFTFNEFVLDGKLTVPLSPKWRWFLLGGVGAYIWDLTAGVDSPIFPVSVPGADGTDFGANVGTGFEYMINPEVGLGAEVDYTHIWGNFDDGYVTFYGNLIFHFGRDLYRNPDN